MSETQKDEVVKPSISDLRYAKAVSPTEIEYTIVQMWKEVLHIDHLGLDEDFFELGGDSLLYMQMIVQVRSYVNQLGGEIDIHHLFRQEQEKTDGSKALNSNPAPLTVNWMVHYLEAHLSRAQTSRQTHPILPKNQAGRILPLSFAQQRLWFLDQLEPNSPIYCEAVAFRLCGKLQIGALEESIHEVICRHEILRTIFVAEAGKPSQIISPTIELPFQFIDLMLLPVETRELEDERVITNLAHQPFDLTCGPLIRAYVLRQKKDEHIFLLTMHHIIADGWSTGVLWRELSILYSTYLLGQPSPLPPLPIQYGDYVLWQREWMQGPALEEQLAYWKQQLGGTLPLLQLPTNRPRLAVPTHQGSQYTFNISKRLTASLRELSRSEGATLFMTLLATFQTLLYRYSGQEDICIGSPIANRIQQETEELIGFFTNTLVMRTNLSGTPTFREVLRRVRKTALGAYAHQDLPFERLVEELHPERHPSIQPLFQVMFVFQNFPAEDHILTGLDIHMLPLNSKVATFDLTLTVWVGQEELNCVLEYSTQLFDAPGIERMAGHFQTLLKSITAGPDRYITDLLLLTDSEWDQLLTWSRSSVDGRTSEPPDLCLMDLFEAQATYTPEATAVAYADERLTYSELDSRANQLARFLQEQGIRSEVLVGICMERSLEMIIGLLGILKAGGAYVPLDPSYPEERLAFMVEDTKMLLAITTQRLSSRLPSHIPHICLDRDRVLINRQSIKYTVRTVAVANTAYVIYTSGSTGTPKGVVISQQGLVNYVHWASEYYAAETGRGSIVHSSIAFDLTITSLLAPLVVGGCVNLISEGQEIENLSRELRLKRNFGLLKITPAHLEVLNATLVTRDLDGLVRTVVVGGEELLAETLTPWRLYAPNTRFINEYGPTETVVGCCIYEIPSEGTVSDSVPIGRPIANTELRILDRHLWPIAIGVVGELYIGGYGLARGYLNLPEMTAEKFIPDPFSTEPGARLYRTGDMARYLPDGNIEFLGRIDQQVKIRGFRIELGEIETSLVKHPAVGKAVVTLWKSEPDKEQLVAYLVPTGEELPSKQELRAFLQQKLPSYMIPTVFIKLGDITLTPNGKVERDALPAPNETFIIQEGTYIAPRTLVEKYLEVIWKEILGIEQVGINDNFFSLGGHSLLSIQLVSRIDDTLRISLSVYNIFEFPTIAELATYIESVQPEQFVIKILPQARSKILPLTLAQQRFWFLERLLSGRSPYNIPLSYHLYGPLHIAALEHSFFEIIRRHEILRSSFIYEDEQPVQFIAPALSLPLSIIDLRELPKDAQQAEIQRLVLAEAQFPFDFVHAPLLRVKLLRLDESEHILLLTAHHIVFDGWSEKILRHELNIFYTSFITGTPPSLPDLPIQYADFALWQQEWLQSEAAQTQLAYWTEQLRDIPVLALPTDRPRPAIQTYNGAYHFFKLPSELAVSLKKLSRQSNATLFITLLAAFQTLLHRYTGQNDIAVGTLSANRTYSTVEHLIGCFLNTLVIRADFAKDPDFHTLLRRVRETTLAAYANQDVPFEKLLEVMLPERDTGRSPLFQVLFVLQNIAYEELLPGLTVYPVELKSEIARFDLVLEVTDTEDGLTGFFEYNIDLFDATTIERMSDHFQVLLKGIVAHPDQPISMLPILLDNERQRMLTVWNASTRSLPEGICFHQLFEEQVKRTPDRCAAACGERYVTYERLNSLANGLAIQLVERGVGPEVLVALLSNRGIDLLTAMLAIFKAGGVYLPLDPLHPIKRIAQVLNRSGAKIVIAEGDLLPMLTDALEIEEVECPQILCLEELLKRDRTVENLVPRCSSANLAYVLYTSGSTGVPKGAMIEQAGMLNHLYAKISELQLTETDVVAQNSSQCFDISIWQFLAALLVGGKTHIFTTETAYNPMHLIEAVRQIGVTILQLVPSMLSAIVQYVEARGVAELSLRLLRWVVPTGEALPPELCRRWLHLYPNIPLLNAYGPTECSDDVTHYQIHEPPTATVLHMPIGYPLANMQAYILDQWLAPVPIGCIGELYIGGIGVGRGYLCDPQQTAEVFLPNPFAQQRGDRLYRTGDVVQYLPDGSLKFLGRRDNQVKLRGNRIELGEIEAALTNQSGIREGVVLLLEDASGDKKLVAYVVTDQHQEVSTSELRRSLQEQIPPYMIPSSFMFLDSLPLTSNGKVDRKALPALENVELDQRESSVIPRTETEKLLAGIWQQVLEVDHISIYDNFFDLGGHSLLVIQVILQLYKALQIEIPLRRLFEARTLTEMAKIIDQMLFTRSDDQVTVSRPDWQADAFLDPAIAPGNSLGTVRTSDQLNIFFTGATGFLGIFLLHELLQQTRSNIYCLVRASSPEEGKQKLLRRLAFYGLPHTEHQSRLFAIVGDLAQPRLGLSSEAFERIAQDSDLIYHSGAIVNFIAPYQDLKATNVLGTQEVLRLAFYKRVKPLHYISTLAVFDSKAAPTDRIIREDTSLDPHVQWLDWGYSQSKWVSEKLVTQARARGLPVSIYRPGNITGLSQSGTWDTHDFLSSAIIGCIQLGSIPATDEVWPWDLMPVDYVSRAIVTLSRQSTSLGKAFHLINTPLVTAEQFTSWITSFGYPLLRLPYVQWRESLVQSLKRVEHNSLHPFLVMLPEKEMDDPMLPAGRATFDCQNTLSGLASTPMTCPPTDRHLLHTHLSYFVKSGLLPQPVTSP